MPDSAALVTSLVGIALNSPLPFNTMFSPHSWELYVFLPSCVCSHNCTLKWIIPFYSPDFQSSLLCQLMPFPYSASLTGVNIISFHTIPPPHPYACCLHPWQDHNHPSLQTLRCPQLLPRTREGGGRVEACMEEGKRTTSPSFVLIQYELVPQQKRQEKSI